MPGDTVTVNGIVKALNLETIGAGRSTRDKATFIIYINVNSIKSTSCSDDQKDNSVEFLPSDITFFKNLQKEPDPFKLV